MQSSFFSCFLHFSYSKFIKSKDLSRASNQDLACIFGQRSKSAPATPQDQSEVLFAILMCSGFCLTFNLRNLDILCVTHTMLFSLFISGQNQILRHWLSSRVDYHQQGIIQLKHFGFLFSQSPLDTSKVYFNTFSKTLGLFWSLFSLCCYPISV